MVRMQKVKERLGPERKTGSKIKKMGKELLKNCGNRMFVTDRYDTLSRSVKVLQMADVI
jgi:hypothetical protein